MTVSLVIPIYNVAPYLRACLCSLMDAAQEVKKTSEACRVEIVCVDDGSTDGSGEILADFEVKVRGEGEGARKGLIFKVLHQQNLGVSAARNAGLAAATGDWVMFVDGDDVVRPETFRWLAETARDCPQADAMMYGLTHFPSGESCVWPEGTPEAVEMRDVAQSFAGTPTYNFTTVVARRPVIDDLRFEGLALGEDNLFLARLMSRVKMLAVLPQTCYGYRARADSSSVGVQSAAKVRDRIASFDRITSCYLASEKTVPTRYWKMQGENLLELIAIELLRLSRRDRRNLMDDWLVAVRRLASDRRVAPRQRLRARIVAACPWTFPLLAAFPYWLKKRGLHR